MMFLLDIYIGDPFVQNGKQFYRTQKAFLRNYRETEVLGGITVTITQTYFRYTFNIRNTQGLAAIQGYKCWDMI